MAGNELTTEIYIGGNGNWYINNQDTGVHAQGEPGKSAYEIAKGLGFDGTETDWLNTLRGKAGATGPKGEQGERGEPGIPGENGITPHIGVNGNWYIGETDTMIAASGPKGDRGDTGAAGPKGDTGATGPRGVQGIQGPKGDKGDPGPVNLANNLTTTAAGYALDAQQGKVLNDQSQKMKKELDTTIKKIWWKGLVNFNGFSINKEEDGRNTLNFYLDGVWIGHIVSSRI